MQKQTDRHGVVYSSTPNVAPLGARVGCDMNVSQKRNPYTTLIKIFTVMACGALYGPFAWVKF